MGKGVPLEARFATLTLKQREVLDLLIQHKTPKEIARRLRISPYTVDQRIAAARKKIGARSRNELAESYQRNAGIYQELAYQTSYLDSPKAVGDECAQDEATYEQAQNDPNPMKREAEHSEANYRVVPEIFEGPYGILARLVVMALMTIMLLVIVLGGLAAFGQLSDLLG